MGFVSFSHVVLGEPWSAASGTFWSDASGGEWVADEAGPAWTASLVPDDGDAYVHRIDREAPATFVLEVDDVEAAGRRLVGLGATATPVGLASPGGLPFLLVPPLSARRPPVNRWPDGSSSRLVQLCLDCPPAVAVAEAQFWAAATGWAWVGCHSPEFVCHLVPDDGPLQLLVQRRDSIDPPEATLHLDLGTSDHEAEAARLAGLGASRVVTGRGWVVLADPDGRVFCATGQPPDAPP